MDRSECVEKSCIEIVQTVQNKHGINISKVEHFSFYMSERFLGMVGFVIYG